MEDWMEEIRQEKLRDEFNKSWDLDEDVIEQERREKKEKCLERIKEIIESEMELKEKVSEIEYEIKSLQ